MTDRFRLLSSVIFLGAALALHGQDAEAPPPPVPEAPESLFDSKIGDVGVVLKADGTWTTRLATGWGEGFSPQGALPGLGYPGYDTGPVFTQIPDFTLTLWLMERYYIDINFGGDFADRTFELGYVGKPGEFVQWVKAGDAPFAVPTRAGQTLSEGRRGDAAVGAAFTTGPTAFETALRYESGVRETREFQGYVDLATSRVSPQAWITNRFFRLPGSGWSSVQILVADPAGSLGTGGGYRLALSTEASFDPSSGEIDLPTQATKRYLVSWNGTGWTNAPTPLLGLTATAQIDPALGPGSWYVLTQPGYSSPFEIRNRYPMAKGATGSIVLYDDKATTPSALPGWTVGYSPLQDWFAVSGVEEAPFLSQYPGIYPSSSATRGAGTPPPVPGTLDWSFHLPLTTTATAYVLGNDIIGSSLLVTRNGVATTTFAFDQQTGILTFDVPVFDTDLVEISYQRAKSADPATNLAFWQGGRWDIAENQNLEWALQGQWNMSQQSSTTENLQSPGQLAATVAWSGKNGEWDWSLAATGGARLSDSTGVRMLYGQSDSGNRANLDGDALRPSASPDSQLQSTAGFAFNEFNRAPTYFKDFWSTDPLTGSPTLGPWNPLSARQPWGSGGWIGPYYVLGDGQRTDRLIVAESDMAVNQWTGMEVFLNKGKTEDLSGTTAVTVTFRVPQTLTGTGGNAQLFLEAGNLSRNFDGTGAVRSVTYLSHPALPFQNQKDGLGQYFPIPENSGWGNDADSSGSAGQDGSLVVYPLSLDATNFSLTSSGWQTVTLTLTAADRQKLTNATGWRLVMATPTGWSGVQTKTLLVGPVIFEGSTWSVVPETAPAGSALSPVEYADPVRTNGHDLEVTWSNRVHWSVEGRNPTLDPRAYRSLSFQYQVLNTNSPTQTLPLTLFLGDAQGHGVTATWIAPVTSGWATAKLSLRTGVLTVNGVPATGASVSTQSGATGWDRMVLTKGSTTGDSSGTLLLTEVEATDAVWEPIGNTKASATWTQTTPWPSSELPLVSGVVLGLKTAQDGVEEDTLGWSGLTNLSGSFGPFRASGEALYAHTPLGNNTHGAYTAALPLGWSGGPSLELSDQFSDYGLRAEKVTAGVPWAGTFLASAKASGPPTTLSQEYRTGWTTPTELPEGWKGSALASWDQSSVLVYPLSGFAQTWVDSWSWLSPPATIASYYQLQGQSTFSIDPTPLGLGIDAVAKTTQAEGSTTIWTPSGRWTLRFPIHPSPESNWTLTPSVSRETDGVYNLNSPSAPRDSVDQALAEITARGLLGVPFVEQFSSASPWSSAPVGIVSGSVLSTVGLELDRTPASDWSDLVVPSSGLVQLTTNRGWDSGAEFRAMTTSTSLVTRANNLFGTLGSDPVFTWYRTDTWAWSVDGSWGVGTRTADNVTSLGVTTRSDLVLTQAESVGLPVVYKGTWGPPIQQTVTLNNGSDWTQSLTLKPHWTFKGPAGLPFDLPVWISPRHFNRLFVQEVSSTLDLGWPLAPQIRNLEIVWKGRFLLSDKSEFDLTTAWGQQWQVNLYKVGLEASLDLILAF